MKRHKVDKGQVEPAMAPAVDANWLQDVTHRTTFEVERVHGRYVVLFIIMQASRMMCCQTL